MPSAPKNYGSLPANHASMGGTGETRDTRAHLREEIAANPDLSPDLSLHPHLLAKTPPPVLHPPVRPTKIPAPLPQTSKQGSTGKPGKPSPAELGLYGPNAVPAAGGSSSRNWSRPRGCSPGPASKREPEWPSLGQVQPPGRWCQRERPLRGTGWPDLAPAPALHVPKQCNVPPPPPAPKRVPFQEHVAFTPGQSAGSGLRNRSSSPSYQNRPKPKPSELPADAVPKAADAVSHQSETIGAVINLGNPDDDSVPLLREWTVSLSENSANIPDPQMNLEDAEKLDDSVLVELSVAEFANAVDDYYQDVPHYGNWVEYIN